MKRSIPFLKTTLFLMTSFLGLSGSSWAGREIGNGGHTLVCRLENASTSYELYDLYEGRELRVPRLNILKDNRTPFLDQVEKAVVRIEEISPLFGQVVRTEVNQVLAHLNFVRNQDLTFINDGGTLMSRPLHCEIEQLANYTESDDYQLLISRERFDALSLTDQAALIIHEAIYKLDRMIYATHSLEARKLVGYLFSMQKIPDILITQRAQLFIGNIVHQGPFVFSRLQQVFKNLSTQVNTTIQDLLGPWEIWGKANVGNQGTARFLYRGRRYTRYFEVVKVEGTSSHDMVISDKVMNEGLEFHNQEILRKRAKKEGPFVVFSPEKPGLSEYVYKCLGHKERVFAQEELILLCEQSQYQANEGRPLTLKLIQYIVLNRPVERF